MLDFYKVGKYSKYTVMGVVNRDILSRKLVAGLVVLGEVIITLGLTIIPLGLFPFL